MAYSRPNVKRQSAFKYQGILPEYSFYDDQVIRRCYNHIREEIVEIANPRDVRCVCLWGCALFLVKDMGIVFATVELWLVGY